MIDTISHRTLNSDTNTSYLFYYFFFERIKKKIYYTHTYIRIIFVFSYLALSFWLGKKKVNPETYFMTIIYQSVCVL